MWCGTFGNLAPKCLGCAKWVFIMVQTQSWRQSWKIQSDFGWKNGTERFQPASLLTRLCLSGEHIAEALGSQTQHGSKERQQQCQNRSKWGKIWLWMIGKQRECACACECVCVWGCGLVIRHILQRCEVITRAVIKARTHTGSSNCVKRACVCACWKLMHVC